MELLTSLLEHQKEAYDKLIGLTVGALYMEMGTGKTRTTLEFIKTRLDQGKIDKVIWFCPNGTRGTLKREFNKHCTGWESVIGLVGLKSMSQSVALNSVLYKFFQKHKDRIMLVVDESDFIKNPYALRTERITRLSEFCKYKVILNGTPITKNEADLFSQWYLLDWRILGYKSYYSFQNKHIVYSKRYHNKIDRIDNVEYLIKRIEPYTYQVKKDECLDLPDKYYDEYTFSLTSQQKREYGYVCEEFLDLEEDDEIEVYQMFAALQAVLAGYSVSVQKNRKSKTNKIIKTSPMFSNPNDNPRIQALLHIVNSRNENKIIIFIKYTDEIKWITKALGENKCARIYGEMKIEDREKEENRFRDNSECRFLIANKSCTSHGLNLQFCNLVIYYNNDFNYGTRLQSEDRIHRIGTEKDCQYIDIYAPETLDETILDNISTKGRLLEEFKGGLQKQQNTIKKYVYYKRKTEIDDEIMLIEGLDDECISS